MASEKISVIIPVKNEEKKISRCLEAVFNQTVKPNEVIVVDGHSSDKTVEIAKKFPIKVLYENFHTRAGACEIGVENVTGEFVAFTDADCIPSNDWLEKLRIEFDTGIIGVGGSIRNLGNSPWEKSINLAMGTFLGSANSVQGRIFRDKRYVKSISGCNSLYRREDILKVGGFDVKLITAEDTELNKKLLKFGKLLYTPDAIISHNHQRGLNEFGKRMFQYGYGRARGRLWDLQVIPPILIFILLVLSIIKPIIFFILIMLYFIMILVMGVKFFLQEKDFKYFIYVPIVYIIEHIFYIFGFWKGIVK